MPGAPSSGTHRKNQENFSVGIVEGTCGYRTSGVSVREKFVLSRHMGYKTMVVAMLLNVVRTPGKPTPKSIFRDGT